MSRQRRLRNLAVLTGLLSLLCMAAVLAFPQRAFWERAFMVVATGAFGFQLGWSITLYDVGRRRDHD